MFAEDPEQTVVTMETQGTRKTQAESKIHVCEEQLAKFQAAINAKNAANTEAAAPAVTEAPAPATRPAPRGPGFEKRSLPSFRSGELREYPTFKANWKETVKGYYEPAEERRAIREQVPKEIKPDIIRLKTMEEIWEFLDSE